MSKSNTDFFEKKKDWSRVKDALLGAYLPVYFSKVMHTGKPIVFIDGFAGAGRFNDGEDGSPRIALAERKRAIERSKNGLGQIDMFFVDPVYADTLLKNISDYPVRDANGTINVIRGTYERSVPEILSRIGDANVFLYVDPFGIKNLDCDFFAKVCQTFGGHVELLLNLNSFGFVREACRVKGVAYNGEPIDLEERDGEFAEKTSDAERQLNTIAGGCYWQRIIDEYRMDNATSPKPSLTAEKKFSACFRRRLSKDGGGPFSYVLDIPIRIKAGTYPKYRMVYATNHPDGCIAMADNMIKRAGDLYVDIVAKGQMSLFKLDANQEPKADDESIRDGVMRVVERHIERLREKVLSFGGTPRTSALRIPCSISLTPVIADFFCENGVVCAKADVVESLKRLEREGVLKVSRSPAITNRGTPTSFWSEEKGKQVNISLKDGDQ